MSHKRLSPRDRKSEILTAAIRVAEKPGSYARLTRAAVAAEATCTEGLVSRYFGTMISLKRAVMRAAVQKENLAIVAQGIACNDGIAAKAPTQIRTAALQTLV
jgi:AcrR family transcriptional regulator